VWCIKKVGVEETSSTERWCKEEALQEVEVREEICSNVFLQRLLTLTMNWTPT
jgi:hypothetical protein